MSAVVVVTKRRATGPIVLDALNSGRHVLSEKPMAYTTAQAVALAEAARRHNLVYSIGYMKRHDAGVARAIAELARIRADQSLGRIIGARGWCFGGDTGRSQDNFVMTGEVRPDGLELWQDGPDWMPGAMRPGYDNFLNVFSHIINLARYVLGSSPAVAQSTVETSGAATVTLDFDGVACALQLVNGSEGVWREGLSIEFERGAVTIELPPPFAEQEAEVILDRQGQRTQLSREHELGVSASGRCIRHRYRRTEDAAGFRRQIPWPTSPLRRRSGNGRSAARLHAARRQYPAMADRPHPGLSV